MTGIKVERVKLLGIMRANRQKHKEEYEKAFEEYRKVAIVELEKQLALAKEGKPFSLHFEELLPPQSYLSYYDHAIGFIDMGIEDAYVLDQFDYRRFVADDWDWKESFTASNSKYLK